MPGEFATAFGLGILATASPCALPLYPGFLAFNAGGGSGRGSRWLGAIVLAGVLSMMLALGAVIAALSLAVGQVLVIVTPLADLLVIALGLALIAGLDPFARVPVLRASAGGSAARAAFVYGLMYGPIALPCSGALLVAIFTLSTTIGTFAERIAFFLFFGLGFGLPLLAISLLAEARQRALVRAFTQHHTVVSRAAGGVLVLVGAWDFAANLPVALLYLGG